MPTDAPTPALPVIGRHVVDRLADTARALAALLATTDGPIERELLITHALVGAFVDGMDAGQHIVRAAIDAVRGAA